jgi:hypothetical protein
VKHAKNQHYVPRLYLRQFAAEGGKHPPIYSFDKTCQLVRRPSIRVVAAGLHFYERGDHGVEKAFTHLESLFTGPYQRLLRMQNLAELSDEDLAAVVVFLAAQLVRTREHREHLKSVAVAIRDFLTREGAECDPEWLDVSDETLRAQHVAMLPDLIDRVSATMLRMKRILLLNHTSIPLWTSDHPVVTYNSSDGGLTGNLGLTCRGVEVHFPLTPTRSLCLCDPVAFGNLPDTIASEDVEHMRLLNSLQVIRSTRFVFSSAADFSLAKQIVSEHPHYADPNRQRVQAN